MAVKKVKGQMLKSACAYLEMYFNGLKQTKVIVFILCRVYYYCYTCILESLKI